MTAEVNRAAHSKEEVVRVRDELRRAANPRDGKLPRGATLRRLREKWLPQGLAICRNQDEGCEPSSCNNRCASEYWLGHSEVVAALMRRMAELAGDDPKLYESTGLVHDLDYLRAPHDLGNRDVSAVHPLPLVRDLMALGAPPILSLAVLEHSPHLNLAPSSPLSEALIACDDAATLASVDFEAMRRADLPPEIKEILIAKPPGRVAGKYRNGMARRMLRAFAALKTRKYHFPGAGRGGQ